MDKELWQKIEKIFYSATELPRAEREAFVREACAGDETLRREVESLLEANRDTESFLGTPPALAPRSPAGASARLKYCLKCKQTYASNTRLCPDDQEILSLKDPYHLVGTTLLEKYKILALIGVGGMGAVYCAEHTGIDRRIAFKILQPNVALGNEYVVELFEREARLAGRLSNENIVDVKDAGHTPDGIAYIAMEWLEGRTLDEELARIGRFDFRRGTGIIRQIANALSAAHAERIVHRDLKPSNIMLLDTADGHDHVKVLDFGIGKVFTETTGNSPVSALVGTPQYASPEQLTMGAHVDGRSDLYSLGVIYYHLLAGQLPFRGTSISELLHLQLTAAPKPLGTVRPETPPEIERLVHQLLAKIPADRPQKASELLARLDQILGALSSVEEKQGTLPLTRSLAGDPYDTSEMETRVATTARIPKRGRLPRVALASSVLLLAAGYGAYRYWGNAPSRGEEKTPAPTTPSVVPAASDPAPSVASPSPIATMADRVQLQANQQKAAAHLQQARSLYGQGEYQRALAECNLALKLNPRNAEARQLQKKINDILKILNNR